MKRALILSTVSGLLHNFDKENIHLLQNLGYEVHYGVNMEEVHFLFDDDAFGGTNIVFHHINISKSPKMLRMNYNAYNQIKKVVGKYDISLIHCHTPMGGALGRLLRLKFGKRVKIVYTAHGLHFYNGDPLRRKLIFLWAEKAMARLTDALITVSREDYKIAKKFKLQRNGKCYQIPGIGLDIEKFKPYSIEEKKENRKASGIGEDILHLATVGDVNENKNHLVVLKALHTMRLMDSKLAEKVRYSVWGDGLLMDVMKREIKNRKLEGVVVLKGNCKEIEKSLSTVDALVFPSISEGLGMVALEALAMGIPIIASNNRSTREYMKHQENGYVCDQNTPHEYIEGIRFLRNLDEEERLVMEKNCVESCIEFCKCQTAKIMNNIYHRVGQNEYNPIDSLCICNQVSLRNI
jgi:glycosyltransferase EpsD